MKLSKTELETISFVGEGIKNISDLAVALKISESQVYRVLNHLKEKEIIDAQSRPIKKTHISLMFKLLTKAKNLSGPFSGTGLRIFSELTTLRSISQLERLTGLHKTTILKKIRQARKMSLLIKDKNMYRLNEKLWSDAIDFFLELKRYDKSIDDRVPASSIIYYKDEKKIIFSSREDLDAALTGLSAFKRFGIKVYPITNYYHLPNRELGLREVFDHTIKIIEKEMNVQDLILLTLFYQKYKKELKDMRHPLIDNIQMVLRGHKLKGYPEIEEVRDRARIYGIKV